MNIKNNKRRQETVKKIEEVFMELLEGQELAHIKVTDICNRAGINRGTFYANFEDVYDLAEKMHKRLKEEVNHFFERDIGWEFAEGNFLKLLEHIKENQTIYTFYFKLGFDKDDESSLYDIDPHNYNIRDVHLDYHISFFKGGFNAIVKKWLNGGCKETPQEMRDILYYEYRGRYE